MPAREIDVRKQQALTLRTSLSFCLKGISHRLFRSSLTQAVVLLAVAFFMTLLTESVILKSAAKGLEGEIAAQREATVFMNKLYSPLTPVAASEALSAALENPKAIEELARVSGLKAEKVQRLAESCRTEHVYLDFFDKMGVGQRQILVKKNKGREIFIYLSESRNWMQFLDLLEPLRSLKLPTGQAELKSFVEDYKGFESELADFAKRHESRVKTLSSRTRSLIIQSSLEIWLCSASRDEGGAYCELVYAKSHPKEADSEGLDNFKAAFWDVQAALKKEALESKETPKAKNLDPSLVPSAQTLAGLLRTVKTDSWLCFAKGRDFELWESAVKDAGFDVDQESLVRVMASLRKAKTKDDIAAILASKEKKAAWKKAFFNNPPLDKKMETLANLQVQELLGGQYSLAQLEDVERMTRDEKRLSRLERELSGRVDTKSGSVLSGRQMFLLLVSFLVCMVGIANAMLMAITERFREIATMKCLGATDGFILTQFLLEAAMQGVCGGVCGMLIGFTLALLKNVSTLGLHALLNFPVLGVICSAVAAVSAGVLLAMLASVYPSWSASRMAPMEAMRVE